MRAAKSATSGRWRRIVARLLAVLLALYVLLLIPGAAPPAVKGAGEKAFAWQRDAYWSELESGFLHAKAAGCEGLATSVETAFTRIQRQLDSIGSTNLLPSDPNFGALETNFFQLAPMVAACPVHLAEFLKTFSRLRNLVKRQSEHWPMNDQETREQLYQLLYGGRAAVEEAILQAPPESFQPLLVADDEPSATPSAVVRGVTLHSGDILISRGGAATSALIARGNDFLGNFSHVALVYVNPVTTTVSVIEAHIECGVAVSSIQQYLADTKLRIMVLRPRADLPALVAEPLLPHRAASNALYRATSRHIPYDFEMDYSDPTKQFCSEVASSAYHSVGLTLWMGQSHLSSHGLVSWLAALGVRHFETQEPSDLEYDPQLVVVGEWRDPQTLFKDHMDNAVIDAMLERAEAGEKLDYNHWMLPVARLAKAYSVVKNWFGGVGPVPEGMSATTALRVEQLKSAHAEIKARLLEKVAAYKSKRGYTPPYWELVRMARDAMRESPGVSP